MNIDYTLFILTDFNEKEEKTISNCQDAESTTKKKKV